MKIAVEGCAHGELDNIYSTIKEVEEREKTKIDLLICCGDFQSSRNVDDLTCMAVPPKYRHICSFYKYFSGEKKAPILTIFIGGNHEASNYLQELPYGGWVAPNIYYLGYAGVINIAGVRIGGISGIYKGRDFSKGRYEKSPYDENTKRSVYHIRNLEVFRLKQISQPIDIFLSHDWPTGVYHHGNVAQLLKRKPFFKDEIDSNQLGSKPCEELLNHLQPRYWFSAHLHCKFAALVPHETNPPTKFLALDKCLPRRQFLQIVDIPHTDDKKIQIDYDLEWLTILHLTNHLLNVKNTTTYMPGPGGNERYNFTPSDTEKTLVLNKMNNSLKVSKNFWATAVAYQLGTPTTRNKQPDAKLNPQTVDMCDTLGIDDPICLISESNGLNLSLDSSFLENTTFLSDTDDEANNDDKVGADVLEKGSPMSDVRKTTPMKLPQPKITSEDDSSLVTELRANDLNDLTPSKDGQNIQSNSIDIRITNESTPDVKEEELEKIENSLNSTEESQKTSPKRTLGDDVKSVDSQNSVSSPADIGDTPNIGKDESPTTKKFKRRNASMYVVENS